MGVRVPGGFAEVTYRMTCNDDAEEMLVTLGLELDTVQAFNSASVDAVSDAWAAAIVTDQSNQYAYRGLAVREGPDGLGPIYEQAEFIIGGRVGTPPYPNTAVLLQKRTSLGGRRNRGRSYIPGPLASDADQAGVLTSAALTLWQANATAWLTETAAVSGVVEVTLFHTTPETEPAIPPTAITSMTVGSRMATQRRRLRP